MVLDALGDGDTQFDAIAFQRKGLDVGHFGVGKSFILIQ